EALRDRGRLGCAGFARFAAIVTPRQRAELHKQHIEIYVEIRAMATTPQWVTRRHRPPHRGTGSAAADRAPTSGARGCGPRTTPPAARPPAAPSAWSASATGRPRARS